MPKRVTPDELLPIVRTRVRKTNQLLGTSQYIPHMTIYYLDLHPYCFYCGRHLTFGDSTLEHLIPRSDGYDVISKPKALACEDCNTLRINTPLEIFLPSKRPMVSPKRAGFRFWEHCPQNGFEYIGMNVPDKVIKIARRDKTAYGLLY